jgi:hypothetical protein
VNAPTACQDCDGVVTATRTHSPHRWMCIHFPRLEGLDPVAPTVGVVLQPYMYCRGINGGFCKLWTRRRDGQLEIGGVK